MTDLKGPWEASLLWVSSTPIGQWLIGVGGGIRGSGPGDDIRGSGPGDGIRGSGPIDGSGNSVEETSIKRGLLIKISYMY